MSIGARFSGRDCGKQRMAPTRKNHSRTTTKIVTLSLLVTFLTTGLENLAQFIPVAHAATSSSSAPNSITRFKTTSNTTGPSTQPTQTLVGTANPGQNMPPSAGLPITHPIQVPLDPSYLATHNTPPGSPVWSTSSEGLLSVGIASNSFDMSNARIAQTPQSTPIPTGAPTAAPAPPTVSPTPSMSPTPLPTGTSTSTATPTPTPAPPAAYHLVFQQTQGGYQASSKQVARFTLQVQDSQGNTLTGVALKVPIQIKLRYQPGDLAGLNTSALTLTWPQTANRAQNKPATSVPVTVDPTSQTMSASISSLKAGPMVLSGAPADAAPASSEHLQMNGNEGQLTYTYPITLPPAAGGLVPPVNMVYSSEGPNMRYFRQAPAPWVGDGWNLSLGSITYDAQMKLYYLNDVGGVSEPLLCCTHDSAGNTFYGAHHHPDIRVTSEYSSPATLGGTFTVRTPDGMEYDLGSNDPSINALRWSVANGADAYYEWDVYQVQRTTASGVVQKYTAQYWLDMASSNGISYTRDGSLAEVMYNYVNGAPQVHVLFNVLIPGGPISNNDGAQANPYGNNFNCGGTVYNNGTTTLRCDDPFTPSGFEAAPLTESTITLQNMKIQVNTGSWHTVRAYNFTYNADTAGTQCWDDSNGNWYMCAGEHTLASITNVPWQNDTAENVFQPVDFTYTNPLENFYNDATQNGFDGQLFNSETWWEYLDGITDWQTGASETVYYTEGYGNTHGVQAGNLLDPTNCYANTSSGINSNCLTGPNAPYDRQWGVQLVTSITDLGVQNNDGSYPKTTYSYHLQLQTICQNCVGDTWMPDTTWNGCNDQLPFGQNCLLGNYANYYLETYEGMAEVTASLQSSNTSDPIVSTTQSQYYAGNGWGTNDWDPNNLHRGDLFQQDIYQGTVSGTLLQEIVDQYSDNSGVHCPAVSGNNQLFQYGYEMCEDYLIQRDTATGGAVGASGVPDKTEKWVYTDPSYAGTNHFYQQLMSSSVTANNILSDSFTNIPYGSNPTFTTQYLYTGHDGALDTPAKSFYLVNLPAQTVLQDGNIGWACSQNSYDGQNYGVNGDDTYISSGFLTRTDTYADCGTSEYGFSPQGTLITTTSSGYDSYGRPIATMDADAWANPSTHRNCSASPIVTAQPSAGTYTSCKTYDTTQQAYVTYQYNDLVTNSVNQHTSATWDYLQQAQLTATGLNGEQTSYSGPEYEAPGPIGGTYNNPDVYSGTQLPGDDNAWTSRTYTYTFCSGMDGAHSATPCVEQDTVQQENTSTSGVESFIVTRKFYDRDGRLIETRTSAPDGAHDLVTYTFYDAENNKVFQSQPCQVIPFQSTREVLYGAEIYYQPTQQTWGSGAYASPTLCPNDTTLGTTTYADALGRTSATDDANGTGVDNPPGSNNGTGCIDNVDTAHHTTCTSYIVITASSALTVQSIDANLHRSVQGYDALGREAYTVAYSGAYQNVYNPNWVPISTTTYQYDPVGHLRKITDAQNNVTAYTYDLLGRLTQSVDPDRGTYTSNLSTDYDANGNLLHTKGPRGLDVYAGYDGLNRQLWRNTTSSATGAYASYDYDDTTKGSNEIGQLSYETFNNSNLASPPGFSTSLSGNYTYSYDPRGNQTSTSLQIGTGAPYTTQNISYNDMSQMLSEKYPDGETVTTSYNGEDALSSLSTTQGSMTLVNNVGYTSQGLLNSASWSNGAYAYSATYNTLLQQTDVKLTHTSTTMFEQAKTYDPTGNILTENTTLANGIDNQAFCYDEQNRLTWAGSTGTPPCSGVPITQGTMGGYIQTFAYDNIGRLTSSPLGARVFDTSHIHTADSIGSTNWTAAYDAAGNMVCRSPNSSTTCTPTTQTGAIMTYDNEGDMDTWQNTPGSPTQTQVNLYDGEGNRVEQVLVNGGTTTTSVYIGNEEEVDTTNGSTTTFASYYFDGEKIALAKNGTFSFLGNDPVGTPLEALDSAGNLQANQLFVPYGERRNNTNGMPNGYQWAEQPTDNSGLYYDGARYYDPVAAQYVSADSITPGGGYDFLGLSHYAYVDGNPISRNDPSGHTCGCMCSGNGCGYGPPTPPTSMPTPVPVPTPTPGPPPTYNPGSPGTLQNEPPTINTTNPVPGSEPSQDRIDPSPNQVDKSGSDDIYRYDYYFYIGQESDSYNPEIIMAEIQSDPNQFFPFGVEGYNGEQHIISGTSYHLINAEYKGSNDPVQVTMVSKTMFRFTTLPGHFDKQGSTITFQVLDDGNGHVFMKMSGYALKPDPPTLHQASEGVYGSTPEHDVIDWIAANGAAEGKWQLYANNIVKYYQVIS